MATSGASDCAAAKGMLPLGYYFSKEPADDEGSRKPIELVINQKKRPVGRPRKSVPSSKKIKLVDYSSSDSERDEPEPTKPRQSVIRRMYSMQQKEKVAEYARFHGIRAAARNFDIHHKNVSRWMKNQVTKLKNPKQRKNRKGQGRKISYPQELEEKLLAWILEKREMDCVAVSTHLIRMKAIYL